MTEVARLEAVLGVNPGNAYSGLNRFDQRLDQTARRAEKSTRRAELSFGRLARTAGALGLGAAIVDLGRKAATLESSLDELQAKTGANAKQMAAYKRAAYQAAMSTKGASVSTRDAVRAQVELAKAGLSTADILGGGMKAAIDLAASGNMQLQDAATGLADALNLFGLKGKDAARVADTLSVAANSTTADVGDFTMALSQGGSAAKAAGLDFNNAVVILEALAKAGIKNSDAGTSMKTSLVQLLNPTAKQAALAKKLGVEFVGNNGKMKTAAQISDMLRAKTSDMTRAQRVAAFATLAGTDGFRTLLSLYDAGPTKINRWLREQNKSGEAGRQAAKMTDNVAGSVRRFLNTVEVGADKFAEGFFPTLKGGLDDAQGSLKDFIKGGDLKQWGQDAGEAVSSAVDMLRDIGGVAGEAAGKLKDMGVGMDTVGQGLAGFGAGKGIQILSRMLLGGAATGGPLGFALALLPAGAAAAAIIAGAFKDAASSAQQMADAEKQAMEHFRNLTLMREDMGDKGLNLKSAKLDVRATARELAATRAAAAAGKATADEVEAADVRHEQALARVRRLTAEIRDQWGKTTEERNKGVDEGVKRWELATDEVKKHQDELAKVDQQLTDLRDLSKSGVGMPMSDADVEKRRNDLLEKRKALMEQIAAAEEVATQEQQRNLARNMAQRAIDDAGFMRALQGRGRMAASAENALRGLVGRLGDQAKDQLVHFAVVADTGKAMEDLEDVVRMVDGQIPQEKVIDVITHSGSAKQAIKSLLGLIQDKDLRRAIELLITADNGPALAAVQETAGAVEALDGKTATITITTIKKLINIVSGFSGGGKPPPEGASGITRHGRATGSGSRDTIPALIKPGEDVVNPGQRAAMKAGVPYDQAMSGAVMLAKGGRLPGRNKGEKREDWAGRVSGVAGNILQGRLDTAGLADRDYGLALRKWQRDGKMSVPERRMQAKELRGVIGQYRAARDLARSLSAEAKGMGLRSVSGEMGKRARELDRDLRDRKADLADAQAESTADGKQRKQDKTDAAAEAAEKAKNDASDKESKRDDANSRKLDKLRADRALASLTAGTGDDDASKAAYLGEVQRQLTEEMARPDAEKDYGLIESLAQELAPDNTTGGAPSADQQAQIDQLTRQRDVANKTAALSNAALSAFSGAAASGLNVTFQSAFPPSATQAMQAAQGVAFGVGLQPNIQSSRLAV